MPPNGVKFVDQITKTPTIHLSSLPLGYSHSQLFILIRWVSAMSLDELESSSVPKAQEIPWIKKFLDKLIRKRERDSHKHM